jgi:hypothetical protein
VLPAHLRSSGDRLRRDWAIALGIGWPVATIASIALEPVPADPEASVPAIVVLASYALLAALGTTAIAAGLRHPSAAVAGAFAGLIALTFTISCPASGHHAMGAWWFGQLALNLGMLAVSIAALGRRAYER